MNQAEQATEAPSIAPSMITRRLAAIAFADVAGFSRLMGLKDVDTVMRWKALRTEIMEPHMARHGGRIAEIAGDAVLVEFPSVVNAVRWATDVQRVQERIVGDKDPFALHLRIGINVDDIIDEDGILQGDGVNVASRIHQAAQPGQIVVTAAVRDYVINRLPLTFHHLGAPVMKNIMRTVHVYSVEWTEGDGDRQIAQPYLQWASRPTLAVLPFRTISGTDDDSYYGEGITDSIITGLSRNRSLYVIARNSTLRYSAGGKDLRQIASELDVRYLLDGSVQRQGTRLRINTELTDILGNVSIWAQRYEGSTDDLFEFQDRIASSILSSIEPRVRAVEMARVADRPTESLDAFHCVLRAMSLLYLLTEESHREAGQLLERAIVLDPSYAQAHAYLAWWLNFQFGEGWSLDPDRDRARALIVSRRAIELDPDDPFALAVAGHILSFMGKSPGEAMELFGRALALNENLAFAWGLSALTLAYLGRPDEALERLQNVWRLNPFDPLNFYFWIVAGIAEFVAGRYDEAIVYLNRSRRANLLFRPCIRTLAAALALSGDEAGAELAARQLLEIEPSFRVSTFVSWYPLRKDDLDRLAKGLRAAGLPE
ncbi:adenylate/guanylate cyclase domain-containing protein [Bradyrhizobium sp. CCGB20]|uniref:adenylate/guanylate cyclase domain-containing protein n=1 Tax=Bradyrhizobium sp. CCGB20 TaxID=2949633 RepID=UPI0020B45A5E|nr:adenylate/guanylate cyclase domain-containing protein [Bradyrhizobium sp. CCGB20]MCP3398040.1 adenylate/guanylate cyclase domain-containing protein [Bradyrhizobium sp. CCGB20]